MDVNERLRASRQEQQQRHYDRGREAGREWAENAKMEQLDRLENLKTSMGDEWESSFEDESQSAWSKAEWIVFKIEPGCDGCREEASNFWESVLFDDDRALAREPVFVRGFAEAAIERWEELKLEL